MASKTQKSAKNSQCSPWVSFTEWRSAVHFLLFAFLIHFMSLQVKVTLNTSSASYYWLCSFGMLILKSVGDYTSMHAYYQAAITHNKGFDLIDILIGCLGPHYHHHYHYHYFYIHCLHHFHHDDFKISVTRFVFF